MTKTKAISIWISVVVILLLAASVLSFNNKRERSHSGFLIVSIISGDVDTVSSHVNGGFKLLIKDDEGRLPIEVATTLMEIRGHREISETTPTNEEFEIYSERLGLDSRQVFNHEGESYIQYREIVRILVAEIEKD